ncbi:YciI family protein [Tistrella mobilis]|uniref:YciI family protein n=1 Tax=Tistrella mobilis TaxID=171437 RepID=UPI003558BE7F
MQYMMVIYETAEAHAKQKDPARAGAYWGGWGAYVEAIRASGIMLEGHGLLPPERATTLRITDGRREVQDGPFADTKERLAGYFVIEVPDLDTALDWAARCPAAAEGAVELRPVMPPVQEPGGAA